MAWNIGSRFFLLAVNGVVLVLSIIALSYAVKGFTSVGSQKVHGHVTNPFVFVISFATLLMVLSMLGIAGGCCATSNDDGTPGKYRVHSNRALMLYFGCTMFCIAGLLYGTMLCFVWADKAEDMIDTYWDQIQIAVDAESADQVAAWMHQNAKGGGVVCLIAMFVCMACAHCSAILMGYKYTARKTVCIINIFGFLFGLVTTIIALIPASQEVGLQNSWLPGFIGALGIITMLYAILGFYAAFRLNSGFLLFNAVSLGIMATLFLGFAIFCMTDADDAQKLLRKEWETVKVKFYDVCPDCEAPAAGAVQADHDAFEECCADKAALSVWHNLSILGITCTATLLSIVGNALGSFYLWRRLRAERDAELEQGEVDGLQDGVSRQTAMDRADKYRAEELHDDL